MVVIPGDLSDHGVEVNVSIGSASQWQADDYYVNKWVKIPRHLICEQVATAYPAHRDEIMSDLHRFSGKMWNEHIYLDKKCEALQHLLQRGQFRPHRHLEKHSNKQEAVKSYGDYEEEPWTCMNLDGQECVSMGVHVVGVMVGYCGYANNPSGPSRLKHLIDEFNLTGSMLPGLIRAAEPGSTVKAPLSKKSQDEE